MSVNTASPQFTTVCLKIIQSYDGIKKKLHDSFSKLQPSLDQNLGTWQPALIYNGCRVLGSCGCKQNQLRDSLKIHDRSGHRSLSSYMTSWLTSASLSDQNSGPDGDYNTQGVPIIVIMSGGLSLSYKLILVSRQICMSGAHKEIMSILKRMWLKPSCAASHQAQG
uniref:Uncharacterized protein n=1 Tax=Micrurus lemniscatus lemniscatus TaxID=129467 RepID=A0A2D4JQL1_MICLE